MFGIRTKIDSLRRQYVIRPYSTLRFPKLRQNSVLAKAYLAEIKKEYKGAFARNFGWLTSPADRSAVFAYKYFIGLNPNNLGNWSIKNTPLFGTKKLEGSIIKMLLDLYHADKQNLEGYITSGGSEGNLFAAWVGKKYLNSLSGKNSPICLIRTDLAHYSIEKSADIIGIDEYITPINQQFWNIDEDELIKTIDQLYRKGYRRFQIPLTLGYPQTGSSDDVKNITSIVSKYQKRHPHAHFFLWIDASLNGLISPFINSTFAPFSHPLIQMFLVDFHKFARVPFPAGVILYRQPLRKHFEKNISYFSQPDATLLGSRPGAAAASIWFSIMRFGKSGYKKIIVKQLENKAFFFTFIKNNFPDITLVSHAESLSCGMIFPHKVIRKIPPEFLKKYGLFAKSASYKMTHQPRWSGQIFKLYFLPPLTRKVLNLFLQDLREIYPQS